MVIHADTSFLIDLLREQTRRRPGRATAFLERHADDRVATSVFAVCELEAGASLASAPDRERARLRVLLQAMTVIYPDDRLPMLYGDALATLRRAGATVATMDLLVATLAIGEGAALVTANHLTPGADEPASLPLTGRTVGRAPGRSGVGWRRRASWTRTRTGFG